MLGLLILVIYAHEITFTEQGVAGVVVIGLSVIASLLTSRSATKAAVKSTEISSRTDIEKEAFERAKGFYTDTIDRQASQITGLEADLATEKRERREETGELRTRVRRLEGDLMAAQREVQRLRALVPPGVT